MDNKSLFTFGVKSAKTIYFYGLRSTTITRGRFTGNTRVGVVGHYPNSLHFVGESLHFVL